MTLYFLSLSTSDVKWPLALSRSLARFGAEAVSYIYQHIGVLNWSGVFVAGFFDST